MENDPRYTVEIKVATHASNAPYPSHDFSVCKKYNLFQGMGLIAGTALDLKQQIDTKHRLNPNAKEITYYYYQVTDNEPDTN